MSVFQRFIHWMLAGVLLVLLSSTPGVGRQLEGPPAAPVAESATAQADRLAAAYDQVGLSFERNDGQVDAAVRYLTRANGYTAFLTDAEATLVYKTGQDAEAAYAVLRYHLQDAQPSIATASDELAGTSNYFIGKDPAKWHKDVPTYGRVTYAGVYPGVDLAYYGTRGALQYDFNVAAGADPGAIRLQIAGADKLELAGGDLLMHTAAGVIRQSAPVIYQTGAGGREPVQGAFALGADGTVGFTLGHYDASRPLVIDPATLVWSTYLGGDIDASRPQHGGDWMIATAVDPTGNVYVAGATDAIDFPLVNRPPQLPSSMHNFFNLSITKFNPTATTILYSSYLGGTRNSTSGNGENGNGMDIVLDSSDRPYIVGWTNDDTFPTTAGVIQPIKGNPSQFGRGNNAADMVAARLSAAGNNLDWSTFYGGALNDYGYGIALGSGASPDVYLYGATRSTDFATTAGAYSTTLSGTTDATVVRLNNTATTRLYSTYLGGSTGEAESGDELYGNGSNPEDSFYHTGGIAVDAAGRIYAAGWTTSNNFPTPNGADTTFNGTRDGFLVKLNPAGGGASDLLYGTYLGTAGRTEVRDLALNGADNVYVAGRTEGIATTAGAYQTAYAGNGDAFASRYNTANSGATSLSWASYLGGNTAVGSSGQFWGEAAYGIAVNSQGSVFLTGLAGPQFPTTADRYSSFAGGAVGGTIENMDAFLAVIDSTGAGLTYSTFLGGREEDWGSGISVDASNCAYLSGSTLSGNHPNPPRPPEGAPYFPTTAGVVYPTYRGGKMDGWVTKMCVTGPTGIEVSRVQAVAQEGGGVQFSWTTASEWQHIGFIIERADRPDAPFAAISDLLRPTPDGSYHFADPQGTAAMRYRLVAIDSRGHRTVGAPFVPGKGTAGTSAPANSPAVPPVLSSPPATAPIGPHTPLVLQPYRLTVPGAGIVHVTYAQLAASTTLAGVNPTYFRLTSGPVANRQEVPLALHTASPGVFAPGDSFDFIAPEAHTPSADGTAYYLSVGRSPGLRMGQTGVPAVTSEGVDSFSSTLALEENHLYWATAPHLGAPQPEGPWFWADAVTNASAIVTLAVPDVVPRTSATLHLSLQGFINDEMTNGYHNVQFVLNGSPLGSYLWYGSDLTKTEVAVRAGILQSGNNTLEVLIDNTYSPLDGVYLNSVDVQYTRLYRAAGEALRFTAGKTAVAVGGFSSPAVVAYDVTQAGAPLQVRATTDGGGGSYTLRYTPTIGGPRTVLAAGPGSLLAPTEISPVAQTNLHGGSADYVVIAHDSLLGAAQQLAAYHASTGLRTVVVPVSAIYDQFGTGRPDPAAIRAFLGATTQWPTAPPYAVLLGAASVDPHNYLGLNTADLVPTDYSLTSFSGRTASDTGLLPSTAGSLTLGRLPARTAAEATAVVTKLITYMTTTHTWPQTATLLSDAADVGRFDASSEALAGVLGNTPTERLYESQYGGTTAARLVDAFNSGRALINFYGHGSASQWGTGDLFDNSRLAQLNNAGREAFVTAMTCHNGDYSWAYGTSTLTALVLQPTGGAIGALGSTATSLDGGQRQLAEAFYNRVLAGDRVGDALRLALATTTDPDVRAQFALLGDPALRVDLRH